MKKNFIFLFFYSSFFLSLHYISLILTIVKSQSPKEISFIEIIHNYYFSNKLLDPGNTTVNFLKKCNYLYVCIHIRICKYP